MRICQISNSINNNLLFSRCSFFTFYAHTHNFITKICTLHNNSNNMVWNNWKLVDLKHKVPPKITPFGFARDLNVNDRLSIQCVVGTGDLPLSFMWLKDDIPIDSSSSGGTNQSRKDFLQHPIDPQNIETINLEAITIRQFDEFTSSLSITSVTRAQAGKYTCRVQNDAAVAVHTAILSVNGNNVCVEKFVPFIKTNSTI